MGSHGKRPTWSTTSRPPSPDGARAIVRSTDRVPMSALVRRQPLADAEVNASSTAGARRARFVRRTARSRGASPCRGFRIELAADGEEADRSPPASVRPGASSGTVGSKSDSARVNTCSPRPALRPDAGFIGCEPFRRRRREAGPGPRGKTTSATFGSSWTTPGCCCGALPPNHVSRARSSCFRTHGPRPAIT